MLYEDVLAGLNAERVRYLVVGGVAVNLWGAQRLTQDLDLLVDLTPSNLRKLVRVMTRLGYQARAPVDPRQLADSRARSRWIRQKGMLAFTFHHPSNLINVVDILIGDRRFPIFARRKVITSAGSVQVPLVSLQDLITMKKGAGRKQDAADAALLGKIRGLLHEKGREAP